MERVEQKFLGKLLFSWENWDEVDVAHLQFYNVVFPFSSMGKYNGMTVALDMAGSMEIFNEKGEIVWSGYPTDISEWSSK